jgi:hypothetical protein
MHFIRVVVAFSPDEKVVVSDALPLLIFRDVLEIVVEPVDCSWIEGLGVLTVATARFGRSEIAIDHTHPLGVGNRISQ